MTTDAAVRIRSARRAFGTQQVLSGLDLDIVEGEFVAMLGHSGSGKSTLLRAMAGLDPEVTGSVLVPRERAVVFQNPRLLPWRRVLPNVTFALAAGDARQRGRAALAEVGLAAKEQAWPATLSGGEAQRVSLARALVREPKLLLLDEPFGALDALTRLKMYELLRALCDRHRPAVLHVTHDVDEAILLADRVTVLRDGLVRLDLPVGLPAPRSRTSPDFAGLRQRLLGELGVTESIGTGSHS
ncbi:ABC transporter ATP-binding protein [Prauserella cavernicola]|uniref:ABC transporter ATP-binding protein n=1 Tax=Prauserella cavernicola TaxID=2800127 RepID=A0A934QWK2_9PSEU|nr:ABC transporter ATP-binding protein [Prauserella cavernicola]MBK1787487.1 ABC transporter ATP-binding protein [Prauserella cavernicola]